MGRPQGTRVRYDEEEPGVTQACAKIMGVLKDSEVPMTYYEISEKTGVSFRSVTSTITKSFPDLFSWGPWFTAERKIRTIRLTRKGREVCAAIEARGKS